IYVIVYLQAPAFLDVTWRLIYDSDLQAKVSAWDMSLQDRNLQLHLSSCQLFRFQCRHVIKGLASENPLPEE
ncbi:hypothetical protein V2J09_009223, partial [Rumex salicifolius]